MLHKFELRGCRASSFHPVPTSLAPVSFPHLFFFGWSMRTQTRSAGSDSDCDTGSASISCTLPVPSASSELGSMLKLSALTVTDSPFTNTPTPPTPNPNARPIAIPPLRVLLQPKSSYYGWGCLCYCPNFLSERRPLAASLLGPWRAYTISRF